jgi:exosortase/archaeosortase
MKIDRLEKILYGIPYFIILWSFTIFNFNKEEEYYGYSLGFLIFLFCIVACMFICYFKKSKITLNIIAINISLIPLGLLNYRSTEYLFYNNSMDETAMSYFIVLYLPIIYISTYLIFKLIVYIYNRLIKSKKSG